MLRLFNEFPARFLAGLAPSTFGYAESVLTVGNRRRNPGVSELKFQIHRLGRGFPLVGAIEILATPAEGESMEGWTVAFGKQQKGVVVLDDRQHGVIFDIALKHIDIIHVYTADHVDITHKLAHGPFLIKGDCPWN